MKAIGRLDHPHIVRAYDAREIEGRLVLAMEFVEGLDLGKVVHRLGRLPVADACELARQAALGLQTAHEHGLVHRDVKPSNLMLTPQGQVKLLDLGLARFSGGGLSTDLGLSQFSRQDAAKMGLSPSAAGGQAHFSDLGGLKNEPVPAGGPDSSAIGAAQPQEDQSNASDAPGTPIAQLSGLPVGDCPNFRPTKMGLSPSPSDDDMTNTGQAMGTADYMAPEQASDSRAVDIRADIYSLGATLYKLLAGQAPFGGPEYHGTFDKMMAHVQQPIPPIQERCPEISNELAAVLDRMLAKTPASRFSTPSEAAEALAPFCTGADLSTLAAKAATCPPLPPGEGRGEGALPRSPLPPGEGQGEGGLQLPSPASGRGAGGEGGSHVSSQSLRLLPAARGRGPNIIRIALLLMFGGLCFALGILITIKRGGKETTVEVPEESAARISTDGHVDVTLPGQSRSATQTPERKEPFRESGALAEDQRAIQGTWQVVRSTFSLVKRLGCRQEISPEAVLKSTRVIITADTLKIVGPEVTDFSFQYRLNPAAKPKMIDLQTPGTFGLVSYGIYEIQGNELKICTSGLWSVDRQGEVNRPDARSLRPTEFWAELGSSKELLVLRRVSDAIVSADEKAIQGDWLVTEAPRAAAFLGFGPGQYVDFSRHSLSTSVPQDVAFGTGAASRLTYGYAIDPTANPNRIDLANDLCPGLESVHGIYELVGDQLKIAWAVSPQSVNTLGMGGMGGMAAGPVPARQVPAPCPPAKFAGPGKLVVGLTRMAKQTETAPARAATREPAARAGTPMAPLSGKRAEATQQAQPGQPLLLGGFGRRQTPSAETLPPTVTVAHPVIREVTDYENFNGQIEPFKTAEVRPRVSGRIVKVNFQPGANVKEGDVLVELDPKEFSAEVDQKRALSDVAFARESTFRDELNEVEKANAKNPGAFPLIKVKELEGKLAEARAAARAAQAALNLAQDHLAGTKVTAPISGKIAQIVPLTIDKLVTADSKEPLATIVAVDSVYVVFDVHQSKLLELRRKARILSKGDASSALTVLCGAKFDDSGKYPYQGKVDSIDAPIDTDTCWATWRAAISNKDGTLLPGMTVRVRVLTSLPYKALLIPEQAVPNNQGGGMFGHLVGEQVQGPHVFVLTTKDGCTVVEPRTVKLGQLHDGLRAVEEGLTANDRVVASGVQGLRPGMRVKPKELSPPLTPPASPPPQAKQKS